MPKSNAARKRLPVKPSAENLRKQAKRRAKKDSVALAEAQHRLAAEYGCRDWAELMRVVETMNRGADQLANVQRKVESLPAAVRARDIEVVREILAAGAFTQHDLDAGLAHASWYGGDAEDVLKARRELFDLLIEHGADPNGQYGSAYGPIVFGTGECLSPEGLEWLIDAGADVTFGPVETKYGPQCPLSHWIGAYARGANPQKHRGIEMLLARGAFLPPEITPPILAIHRGDAAGLGRLLDEDPSLVARTFRDMPYGNIHLRGATLLHCAAEFDEIECCELLLARGADINARADIVDGAGGQTPVFHLLNTGWGSHFATLEYLARRPGSRLDLSVRATWHIWNAARTVPVTPLEYALEPGNEKFRKNRDAEIALLRSLIPQTEQEVVDEFRRTVQSGNVRELEALLARHPELKEKVNDPLFDFGGTAMQNAVNRKDRPMIDALLAAGADLNRRSQWEAGSFGVLDGVDDELGDYLISRGAQVDVHAAAHLGKVDRLRALLDANPELVNARGGDGGTPLHFAKNAEIARVLLERGADVGIRDVDHGSTAAMWQIKNEPVLRLLIEAGSPVDIYMATVVGDRALAERALREDAACLSAFVSHAKGDGKFAPDTGGNIYNWRIGHAARPIPVAAKFGHRALTEFLLGEASPAERLVALCLMKDKDAVKRLCAAEPGLTASLGKSDARALPDAVHFRDREAAKLMLDAGFPVSAKGAFGWDCLHPAAWHGDAEIARLAIERGASVEDRDNIYSGTPLATACHGSLHSWDKANGDYAGVVGELLGAGADASEQSEWKKSGKTGWASREVIEAIP